MKIIIDKHRCVEKSGISGVKQENNVVTLNFEFPEEIQDFVKYIEFDIGKDKVFDLIENDMYTLTSAITQFEDVQAQIVAKKDEQVWKSKCFDLDFKNSINANHQLEDEVQIDVLNTVIQKAGLLENELIELKAKINNVELRKTIIDILTEYGLIQLESLTQEQIQALNEMTCEIDENGELNIIYDETVLDIDFQVEDGKLIIDNNINATFDINENGELEVSYE